MASAVLESLGGDRYHVSLLQSEAAFTRFIQQEKHQLDCLVIQASPTLPQLVHQLHGQAALLPAVLIGAPLADSTVPAELSFIYHTAEVWLPPEQIAELPAHIELAITQFIHLSATGRSHASATPADVEKDLAAQKFSLTSQQTLTKKLKERLGYLGVYYKRNPQNFFRHLSAEEKQELLTQLKTGYREIVLCYFVNDGSLNQRIDDFVNTLFFSDIAVSQVVEIHMELMDEFSKQLKLEGRSEEILLDYRLTLIDTIAHLCEMYRRSIPRES